MPQSCEPDPGATARAPRRYGWDRLWRRFWRTPDRRLVAGTLYRAVVKQARTPALFRDLGVPDTPEGRFEMIALHAALVLRRLRREGDRGHLIGQELFDLMFADMDGSLRELGASDLSVGTYVKRLARNFYARLAALDEGLADEGLADEGLADEGLADEGLADRGSADGGPAAARSLQPMLRSNVYHGGAPPGDAQLAALADYLVAQEQALANQKGEAICQGLIAWVAPKPLPDTPPAGPGGA